MVTEKNLEFVKYYSGLTRYITSTAKISNRLGIVEDYVNDLEELKMLTRAGIEEASRNRSPTVIYRISDFGVIILLLMRYIAKDTSEEAKIRLRQMILQLIQQYLLRYNSHVCDFLVKLYLRSMEAGFSKSMIELLLVVTHSNKHTVRTLVGAFNRVLYAHLMDERTRNHFVTIWMQTLKGFPEHIQRIIIYHEKAEIESRIHLAQPPKDWEELWISNIENYSQLTLYGKCSQCSHKYPVLVDYYEYRLEILHDGIIKKNCLKCNAANALAISSAIME
jgi:hypothetical protein